MTGLFRLESLSFFQKSNILPTYLPSVDLFVKMLNKTMLSEYYKDVFEEKIVGLDTLTEYKVPEGRTRIPGIKGCGSASLGCSSPVPAFHYNADQDPASLESSVMDLDSLNTDPGF